MSKPIPSNQGPAINVGSITPSNLNASVGSLPSNGLVGGDFRITLNGTLNALNLSHDKKQVVVVGLLKIVNIEENGLVEAQNLRVGKDSRNLNSASVDVKWHPSEQHKNLIATAATNGAVVIWNNHYVGSQKQERVINDHSRTVNRISWHPDHPWTLLSGSQDGTMKLWDIRDPTNCKVTFDGKSESVRDVKFSRQFSNYFAAAFDNGTVQGPVFCIDWHPEDKSLIATGGRDRFIQVWDLNEKLEKKGKPLHTIQTVSSVSHVVWRPHQKYHLASSALVESKVHVWNVKKPFIPSMSFLGHSDVVTDIEWLGSDKILSCGKDSTLQLQHTRNAYRPYQHVRSTGVTWTPRGQLAFINEKINRGNTILAEEQRRVSFTKVVDGKNPTWGVEGSSISVELAEKYRFEEKEMNFPDMCSHNAQVAKEAKMYQISQSWMMLRLFFENHTVQPEAPPPTPNPQSVILTKSNTKVTPFSPSTKPETVNTNSPHTDILRPPSYTQDNLYSACIIRQRRLKFTDLFESEPGFLINGQMFLDGNLPMTGDLQMLDDNNYLPMISFPYPLMPLNALEGGLVKEATNLVVGSIGSNMELERSLSGIKMVKDSRQRSEISTNNHAKSFGGLFADELEYDPKPVILEMLQHYAETGDIQTAVIMSLVLGDRIAVPKEMLKQWSLAYIDILHRLQLWGFANEIIKKSKDTDIRAINQTSTTIHTSCNNCGKPLLHLGWICDTCHKMTNPCSLCHRPVHGRYVWCQICGHGGHIEHLSEWFSEEKMCPTGCGHKCITRGNTLQTDGKGVDHCCEGRYFPRKDVQASHASAFLFWILLLGVSSQSVIDDCVFEDSEASNGGAIYSDETSPLTITNSQFLYNVASGNGGALYLNAGATLSDLYFYNNTAVLDGGAIYSAVSINQSTWYNITSTNNHAARGGAFYLAEGGSIDSSTFNGNMASQDGGVVATLAGLTLTSYVGGGNSDNNHGWAVAGLNTATSYNITFSGQLNCDLFGHYNGSIVGPFRQTWTSDSGTPLGYGLPPLYASLYSQPDTSGRGLSFSLYGRGVALLPLVGALSSNGLNCTINGTNIACPTAPNTGVNRTFSLDQFCGSLSFNFQSPTFHYQTEVPTQGGPVNITGTNFGLSPSVMSISLPHIGVDHVPATSIVEDHREATFEVPAGTGNFSASLTVDHQTVNFFFHYGSPILNDLTSDGNSLFISGANFGANSSKVYVTVNGLPCSDVLFTVLHLEISCSIPTSAKRSNVQYAIQVTVDGQSSIKTFDIITPTTSSPIASTVPAAIIPPSNGLSGGAIAGIVIGSILILIILILIVAFVLLKRKRQAAEENEMDEVGVVMGASRADPATAIQLSLQKS
ncbi:hypothetical protein PROFUN_03301 [Planoprotostelium fungivorum]|uniref:Uncharacterized protein n=1 Tax=Planoprotostelium fungivorum TaxID=1890364 RepID=A0A2P6NWP7_9EUKA|nr:hypothetical protein PROFUN_03301 [Planoprotostelium fungivorum]